jgi:deoxyribodipyrimidine photo-lyase
MRTLVWFCGNDLRLRDNEALNCALRQGAAIFVYVVDSKQWAPTGANRAPHRGFVPNRARMIAASFLAKNLLIDFRLGERHYLEWLVDGDRAQNDLGWQWSSGSGCDAQPYFRMFNPVTQAEKFDPEGQYVRRYVPELARLPTREIHPWSASASTLRAAGIGIGRDYPAPIVEHAGARQRFLAISAAYFAEST